MNCAHAVVFKKAISTDDKIQGLSEEAERVLLLSAYRTRTGLYMMENYGV
jgi:hypothetical protein